MTDAIAYEKFFPAIPLAGTAIAILFDVGYFEGVGSYYFTFFSLAEHIGFALEALPIALVISISAIFFDGITETIRSWPRNRISQLEQEYPSPKEELSSLKRRLVIISIIYLLLSAAGVVYLWRLGLIRLSILTFVFVAMTFISVAATHRWYSSGPIPLFVIGCTTAFLLGEFLGSDYVAQTTTRDTITLKSGTALPVNVIRSGERGVLYAKPRPNIVELAQWDEIKSISRNTKKSTFDLEKH